MYSTRVYYMYKPVMQFHLTLNVFLTLNAQQDAKTTRTCKRMRY